MRLFFFFVSFLVHFSSSDFLHHQILLPTTLQPHPTPHCDTHLTLTCKLHHLNKCDRHCIVCESDHLNVASQNVHLAEVTGFSVRNPAVHQSVVRLSINNQVCHFLPLDTDKFFPNLETLRIWSSGLRKLDQLDIKGFENLKELLLPLNELESLESNLFEFNRKVTRLDLSRNKLKHIGLALFTALTGVTSVNFNHNECIDDNLKNGVVKFIDKVRKLCPPTIEMLKNDVVFLIDQNEKLKLSVDAKEAVIRENCDFSKFEEVSTS